MKKLSSCILIEWRKLIKSKLSIVTACSICLVPFIVGLFATMMKYPENFKNLGLISAKMEMMRITDWSSYLMTVSQVISVGGLLIFGFTASWVFGREYSDKTMIDLLALPIKRDTIVLSKFIVIALWSYILSIFALLLELLAFQFINAHGRPQRKNVESAHYHRFTMKSVPTTRIQTSITKDAPCPQHYPRRTSRR